MITIKLCIDLNLKAVTAICRDRWVFRVMMKDVASASATSTVTTATAAVKDSTIIPPAKVVILKAPTPPKQS